ncbi:pimeloyl-(acyl-carrier protein) methyl ester esterase [Azospirillaceae bacterium]
MSRFLSPILLFVHGWAFDRSFWTPLVRSLENHVSVIVWDLGFRGSASFVSAPPSNRPIVAVGHSFGLMWLLREHPVFWSALVSINGFPRFSKSPDFPLGVAPRVLERMITRLDAEPQVVTRDFLVRCGVAAPQTEGLDVARLRWGLEALAQWDQRASLLSETPTLALAGRSDPIVSAAMTREVFASVPVEWHDGGHLLPITAPDWCAACLRSFLETL